MLYNFPLHREQDDSVLNIQFSRWHFIDVNQLSVKFPKKKEEGNEK